MPIMFPRQGHKTLTNNKGCRITIRKNRKDKNTNAHEAFFSAE